MTRALAGAALALAALCAPALGQARAARGFDPLVFFAGRTYSEGAMLDDAGRPTTRFSGDTVGRREADGATSFDQTIRFSDGEVKRRSFRLVRTGPDTIAVTGSEVVGSGEGRLAGPRLRLLSTVRLSAGNPLSDVDFDQSFTASPDGRRVRNVSTVTKLGFVVSRIDETFAATGGSGRRAR
ncbi:DUF3833 family protein [uncultured Enterovirga sp.]|uniref:DUF3833 family protein n=1 Tax=uncultured Enterovirga sp. TaxID=2026352 RepID=UPI0035CBAD2D